MRCASSLAGHRARIGLALALVAAGSSAAHCAHADTFAGTVREVSGAGPDCARIWRDGERVQWFVVDEAGRADSPPALVLVTDIGELFSFDTVAPGRFVMRRKEGEKLALEWPSDGISATVTGSVWRLADCKDASARLGDVTKLATTPPEPTQLDAVLGVAVAQLEAESAAQAQRNAEAVQLYGRAAELAERTLAPDHPVALRLRARHAYFTANTGQGKFDRAALDRWIEFLRRTAGPDSYQAVDGELLRISALWDIGETQAAARAAEPLIARLTEALGGSSAQTLDAMNLLAIQYWTLGRYEESLALLDAVISAAGTNPQRLALPRRRATQNRGLLLIYLARYDEAIASLQASMAELERDPAGPPLWAADAANNLGIALHRAGRLAESLRIRQYAYSQYERIVGPQHPYTLSALNNLASMYANLGSHEASLPLQRKAYEGYVATRGPAHPETLATAGNLGTDLVFSGQPAAAVELLTQALGVAESKLGPEDPVTQELRKHLGNALVMSGDPKRALQVREAGAEIASRKGRGGLEDLIGHQIGMAQALVEIPDVVRAREALKRAFELLQARGAPFPEEELEALSLAARTEQLAGDTAAELRALERFAAVLEQIRQSAPLHATHVQSFGARHASMYTRLVQVLVKQGNSAAAFAAAERYKARTLLDSLARLGADTSPLLSPQERAELARLRRRVDDADQAIAGEESIERQVALQRERDQAFADYDAMRQRLAANSPQFAAATRPIVIGADEAPRVVPPATCALSFVLADIEVLAFVTARGQRVAAVSLGPRKGLAGAISKLRAAVSTPRGEWRALASDLGQRLLEPLIARCPGGTRDLLVAPDAELVTLPFEVLILNSQPLVQRYAVSYTQSLSVYRALRRRAAPVGKRQTLLAIGAPSYAASQAAAQPAAAGGAMVRAASLEALPDEWPPLPGALEEIQRVARLFDGAVVLTGDDASEDKVREMEAAGDLRKFRYLHFAAHAVLSTSVPELSALVLRQPGNAQWDGYLTAAEWSTLRLESDLIVLSACETALGKHVAGEGVTGLPYALFVAGNRATLLTLWRIPDRSTSAFITSFFERLRAGEPRERALAATKREFLRGGRFAHPAYWGAFALYGY